MSEVIKVLYTFLIISHFPMVVYLTVTFIYYSILLSISLRLFKETKSEVTLHSNSQSRF